MTHDDAIWVYLYQYWDEESQCRRVSSLYATEELIRHGLGVPVHTSAIKVDRSDLKDRGLYIPSDEQPASNNSQAA
jgi:hypothetical protein